MAGKCESSVIEIGCAMASDNKSNFPSKITNNNSCVPTNYVEKGNLILRAALTEGDQLMSSPPV